MGQYYQIFNMDKKQCIDPMDYDNGRKLTEWTYQGNSVVMAMTDLMAGTWAGDHVFVIGDYADGNDPDAPWSKTYKESKKQLSLRGKGTLYDFCSENFKKIKPRKTKRKYRYLYNHATKQVIDLHKCPVEWIWTDPETNVNYISKFSPLPLLLAMGNGGGCGDYCGNDTEEGKQSLDLVGSWCSTVTDIEISAHWVDRYAEYEELRPNFTEEKPTVKTESIADHIRNMDNDELVNLLCSGNWNQHDEKDCLEWLQLPYEF